MTRLNPFALREDKKASHKDLDKQISKLQEIFETTFAKKQNTLNNMRENNMPNENIKKFNSAVDGPSLEISKALTALKNRTGEKISNKELSNVAKTVMQNIQKINSAVENVNKSGQENSPNNMRNNMRKK